MSTATLSAMTAALLSAACLTALADNDTADGTSGFIQAVERNGSHSMHPNAPLAVGRFVDDDASGYMRTVGRNGSHSMHPDAPVLPEQFADDDGQALPQTRDQ